MNSRCLLVCVWEIKTPGDFASPESPSSLEALMYSMSPLARSHPIEPHSANAETSLPLFPRVTIPLSLHRLCCSAPSDRGPASGPDHSPESHRNLPLWHQRKPSAGRLLAKRRQPGKRLVATGMKTQPVQLKLVP